MRAPRVHAVAPLAPHTGDVFLVEDLENQAEPGFGLLFPLQEHRWRAANDDFAGLFANQQLAADEQGLDGFAQAHVVGDEQIDPWQEQGLAERLKLVGVQADAGPEGRLEQLGVRGRNAVPPQGVQVGGEGPGRIESPLGDGVPRLAVHDLRVDFPFPEHFQPLALGVVIDARKLDQRAIAGVGSRHGLFDQVQPLANAGNLAWSGDSGGFEHLCLGSTCHGKGTGRAPTGERLQYTQPIPPYLQARRRSVECGRRN